MTLSQNFVPVYAKNIVMKKAKGSYLWDTNGKKYIDLMAGIAVNIFGHSDERWVDSVQKQLEKLVHISNYFHSEEEIALAKKLTEISFAEKVFFANSGTEANEAALKFACKYGRMHAKNKSEKKSEVISFSRSFHGRSLGSLSVTANPNYKKPFEPLISSVIFAEYNNIDDFEKKINENTSTVIIEPVQGEAGIFVADKKFLKKVRELCDRFDAVLVFDEVQCGLGRTGKMWGYEHFGVIPDILTSAKPLAGGIPMGAVLASEKIAAIMQPGDHGSTFGGSPLACGSALHILERIEENDFALLKNVEKMSEYMHGKFEAFKNNPDVPCITDVRSLGFLLAIEIDEKYSAKDIQKQCTENGLLIVTAGKNNLRFLPPLNITQSEIDEGLAIVEEVLKMQK